MREEKFKRRTWSALVGIAAAVVVAGCGSSSSTTSASTKNSAGTTSSASASVAPAAAQAAATAGQSTPTSIMINTPLKTKPPTGKTIVYLQCSQPVCTGFIQGLQPATKALGWTLKTISFPPTPEGTLAALNSAIQMKPAGIFSAGLARPAIESALNKARAAHIPVVDGYSVDTPAPPVIANIADSKTNLLAPAQAAAYVAATSGCKANVALFNIKLYPILALTTTAFKADLAKWCPSAKVSETDVQATDVGTRLPATVVSTVQKDSSINYLAFAFGDMALGVPAALKAASLNAKIIGYGAAGPDNLAAVKSRAETAETGYGIPYGGWRAMDAFARYFEGMSPAVDTTAVNPGQLFTSSNVSSTSGWNFAMAPSYQQQFKTLWHVG